jgi:nucleotide-binding universal stress UspA family protein
MGSVSRGVVEGSAGSVLVVRRRASDIRRVVIGVDGSRNARRAVDLTARLGRDGIKDVTVVRVIEPMGLPTAGLLPGSVWATLSHRIAALNRQLRRGAQQAQDPERRYSDFYSVMSGRAAALWQARRGPGELGKRDATDTARRETLHLLGEDPRHRHRHGRRVDRALCAGRRPLGRGAVDRHCDHGGLAEVAAGAIAMGLGGYLAARTDAEHYVSEYGREKRETFDVPEVEMEEVASIFRSYGLPETTVTSVAQAIRSDCRRWIEF